MSTASAALKLAAALLAASAAVAALSLAQQQRPVNVSGDEVEYGVDGQNAVFRGNVVISAGAMTLHAATLKVQQSDSGDNIYTAQPAAAAPMSLTCGDCADYPVRAEIGGEVTFDAAARHLRLSGGLSLCADAGCRQGSFTAAEADWRGQVLNLTGAPAVQGEWRIGDGGDEEDRLKLRAEKIRYDFASGDAVLTGDARIVRGEADIQGNIIRLNAKTGALRAEAKSNQRVQATFGGND